MHSAFHQMRWREQEDPGRAKSPLNLPRNLRLHHHNKPNPWKKSSFEDDFILITEFAENEGPKAVVSVEFERLLTKRVFYAVSIILIMQQVNVRYIFLSLYSVAAHFREQNNEFQFT